MVNVERPGEVVRYQNPKNFAEDTLSIGWLSRMSCMSGKEFLLVDIIMALVLEALADRWLFMNQLWMVLISVWKSDKSSGWEAKIINIDKETTGPEDRALGDTRNNKNRVRINTMHSNQLGSSNPKFNLSERYGKRICWTGRQTDFDKQQDRPKAPTYKHMCFYMGHMTYHSQYIF